MTLQTSQLVSHPGEITVPLTTEFEAIAQTFAQQCPLSEKAAQIRQNTLAVCAVNAYLQLLDIDTDLSRGDSWNPMMQMMANVADLKVSGIGTLSCRALLPQADTCHVPPEDWQDRIGYVAVVIDEPQNQAILLGFTPTVDEKEQISLSQFEPIETLIDCVHSLKAASIEAAPAALAKASAAESVTQLNQWIQGTVAATWQALDALINPDELSFAFRAGPTAKTATNISRAQLIDLGIQLGASLQVALIIHLGQISDGQTSDSLSEITIQVHPLGETAYLAEGISLSVLDENHDLFRTAVSRKIDNYIQIQIAGKSGETFSIQISKGETAFTERFVI